MAYTVRTSDDDELFIDKAKQLTDTNTATKALLASARLCVSQHDEINKLRAQLAKSKSDHAAALKVVSDFQRSLKVIIDF
ncbi:hypothetical protein [Motilimonas pumila]|uniref:Uncharacterized protein n=1 Tax=Motilimonas pumila TaxID=2303987 RepID=A0A418Y9C0_9GAMM|nr:hypothetical protein [Motilimonas pumila]RJG36965.1 hypothetical protein D1Z90_20055 [Motilimonas pumila]